jgi:hypothetical protein
MKYFILITIAFFCFSFQALGQSTRTTVTDKLDAKTEIKLRSGGTLIIDGYSVRYISNDPTLGDSSNIDLVTEAAVNAYVKAYVAAYGGGITDLSYTAATGVVANTNGTGFTIPLANGSTRGLMPSIAGLGGPGSIDPTVDKLLGWDDSAGSNMAPTINQAVQAATPGGYLNGTIGNAGIVDGSIVLADLAFTPWTATNDGAGSGLDADLLDGQSGAYYLGLSNHTGTLGSANGGTGLTTLGSALQVLRTNAGGTAMEWATPNNGTVTSVALSMPTGFSVGGSPVTSSGTLAVTTTLNGVIKGNGSGFTAGTVALGSEVSGILPLGGGGTGLSGYTAGDMLFYATGTSFNKLAIGTANQLLRTNAGSTAPEWFTPSYLTANQTITLSGDVTGSGTTAITTAIGTGKVTSTMILDGTIAAADLGQMGATSGQVMQWNGSAWVATTPSGVSGSGVASRLAFWDGVGSLSSNSNFKIDNINGRMIIGTASSASSLIHIGGAGASYPGIVEVAGNVSGKIMSIGGVLEITTGTGASWLGQGIRVDGINRMFRFIVSSSITTDSYMFQVESGGGVNFSSVTSGDIGFFNLTGGNFAPSANAVNYDFFRVSGVVNQTGTATGIASGINLQNTLTSVTGQWRGINIPQNNANAWGVYQSGSITKNYFNGNIGVGNTTASEKIDVTGNVKVSGAFYAADGSAGSPSYTFTNDLDVGFFRPTTNILAATVGGTEVVRWSAGQESNVLGSAAAPSYTFTGDLNNGWWSPAADVQAWSTGGTERMRLTSSALSIGTTAATWNVNIAGSFNSFLAAIAPNASGNAGWVLENSADANNSWMGYRDDTGIFALSHSTSQPFASETRVFEAIAEKISFKTNVINFENISATTASALSVVNGDIVYVNTTDATFTSVGFWGRENGVWVKL